MEVGAVPDEAWTIGEVARLSGVTSRTLRHYDSIGLLTPVGTAAGGRRLYGRDELVRLQQILVLRELGVDLPSIGRIVRSGDDRATQLQVLRQHRDRLLAERDRYDRLAATVATTMQSLDGGRTMAAKDLYAGFDNSEYEVEARELWGADAVDRGTSAWARLGESGQDAHHARSTAPASTRSAPRADRAVLDPEPSVVHRPRPDVRRRPALRRDVRRVRTWPRAVPARRDGRVRRSRPA
jgi:DNA-binding transcriptional MerR regulator